MSDKKNNRPIEGEGFVMYNKTPSTGAYEVEDYIDGAMENKDSQRDSVKREDIFDGFDA